MGQVATIRRVGGPTQVSRKNSVKRVVVEVNVRGRDLGGMVQEARDKLAPLAAELPAGHWIEQGESTVRSW